jgi:hypothetical protein
MCNGRSNQRKAPFFSDTSAGYNLFVGFDTPRFGIPRSGHSESYEFTNARSGLMVETNKTIPQKSVEYTPTDKLVFATLSIAAGGETIYDVNTTLRPNKPLLIAFG